MDFEEIKKEMMKGREIEDIIDCFDWREFELFCARILEEHGWKAQTTFRFKLKRRYEIDILAKKGNRVLAIDCKHWGVRPGKASQLRKAADKQTERVEQLSKIRTLDSLWERTEFYSLLITLLQEDITQENGVWIVPVFKLNDFLLNHDAYLEP